MRKLLLTTAALSALSVPAFAADLGGAPESGSPLYSAAPMVSGDISAALGGSWFSGEGFSESAGAFDTSARFALPLTSGISFEGELLDGGLFNDGSSFNTFLGLAHLYGQTQSYALGVFGGAGSLPGAGMWQAGIEGQAYLGNLTAEGTLGYTSIHEGDLTAWNARFGGKYYFTPNDKLSLFGNYFNADSDFGGGDLWGIDGGYEHRFGASPWSGFVKAAWYSEDGVDLTSALVGVRVSLDAPGSTLQSHDRAVPWQSQLGIFSGGVGGPVVMEP
ncbi:MAG: hypothetical protein J0H94_16940 [Rhizobiales bacterium]|nr:hypothetical protein [Hyphomicrobiales bacterium]